MFSIGYRNIQIIFLKYIKFLMYIPLCLFNEKRMGFSYPLISFLTYSFTFTSCLDITIYNKTQH